MYISCVPKTNYSETGLSPITSLLYFHRKRWTIIPGEIFPERMTVEMGGMHGPGLSSGPRHSSPTARMLHGAVCNWHLPRNCPLLKKASSPKNIPTFQAKPISNDWTMRDMRTSPVASFRTTLKSHVRSRACHAGNEWHRSSISPSLTFPLLCSLPYRCFSKKHSIYLLCGLSILLACPHSSLSIFLLSGVVK